MLTSSLRDTQAELKAAQQRIIECEKAKLNAEKHLEEQVHMLKSELNNLRIVSLKERLELERQRDELAFHIQGERMWCFLSFQGNFKLVVI